MLEAKLCDGEAREKAHNQDKGDGADIPRLSCHIAVIEGGGVVVSIVSGGRRKKTRGEGALCTVVLINCTVDLY